MLMTMLRAATKIRLRRILGSSRTTGVRWIRKNRRTDGERHTALSVHLNQKRGHGNLSDWDCHVEKEDGDPGEEEEVAQLPGFLDDCHMVPESVENGNHAEALCDRGEQLSVD